MRKKAAGVAIVMAVAAVGGLVGPGLIGTAGASPLVKEDCTTGYACGWADASFGTYVWGASTIGNYNLSGAANNSISSIFNNGSDYAIYFDYAGSTSKVCLRPGYQNANLAGTNVQDDISYVQITSYVSC